MVWVCWSQAGTKLLWNRWILSEAVGGGDKNDGKNKKNDSKNDGIWVKKLVVACQGISVTSTPKYLGLLWLGLITINNQVLDNAVGGSDNNDVKIPSSWTILISHQIVVSHSFLF
jgi:hypothetical protein